MLNQKFSAIVDELPEIPQGKCLMRGVDKGWLMGVVRYPTDDGQFKVFTTMNDSVRTRSLRPGVVYLNSVEYASMGFDFGSDMATVSTSETLCLEDWKGE